MTEEEKNSCKFNGAVECFPHERHCNKCGWCPEVAERRIKEFLIKHGIDPESYAPPATT